MICVLESRVRSECDRVDCLSRTVTDYNTFFAMLQDLEWGSGKEHIYHCHVYPDGSYRFKV